MKFASILVFGCEKPQQTKFTNLYQYSPTINHKRIFSGWWNLLTSLTWTPSGSAPMYVTQGHCYCSQRLCETALSQPSHIKSQETKKWIFHVLTGQDSLWNLRQFWFFGCEEPQQTKATNLYQYSPTINHKRIFSGWWNLLTFRTKKQQHLKKLIKCTMDRWVRRESMKARTKFENKHHSWLSVQPVNDSTIIMPHDQYQQKNDRNGSIQDRLNKGGK